MPKWANEHPVVIPLDVIDEDELEEFISRIKAMTHADVKIQRQFVLTCDSPSVLSGLEYLFGEILGKSEYQNPITKKKIGAKQNKQISGIKQRAKIIKAGWTEGGLKPAPTRGPHVRSIRIESTGEMISRFELEKRLAEKSIARGTRLHSPKHGVVMVNESGTDQDSYFLINEQGEQL
jgi:hypothetical protein